MSILPVYHSSLWFINLFHVTGSWKTLPSISKFFIILHGLDQNLTQPIGEGNGNPLQCSCLENPRDGGAWWAAVSGVAQSWTRLKRLSSSSTRNYHRSSEWVFSPLKKLQCFICWSLWAATFFFFFFNFIFKLYITIRFTKYQNESATGIHVFPILNPPRSSLPIPSLWVVPMHQPQASSIVHWTWTGDSFHTWCYLL